MVIVNNVQLINIHLMLVLVNVQLVVLDLKHFLIKLVVHNVFLVNIHLMKEDVKIVHLVKFQQLLVHPHVLHVDVVKKQIQLQLLVYFVVLVHLLVLMDNVNYVL